MNRRYRIVLVNVLIMVCIIAFVVVHVEHGRRVSYSTEIDAFIDSTVALERVTENYLEGEQGICNIWANYIIKRDLDINEAISFIRDSHVLKNTSAHIIWLDDGKYEGMSTRPRVDDLTDYNVSYAHTDLSFDMMEESPLGSRINMTRAYTNPMNGIQSLGFYNIIHLRDGEGTMRPALLIRIVPIKELENKWVFPQETFSSAEFSMIDSEGSYIIKSSSFKSNNFFDFYRSYNQTDIASFEEMKNGLFGDTGSFIMLNSRGENCLITHTDILTTDDYLLVGYLPVNTLSTVNVDWLLIGVVSAALMVLLIIDLAYMNNINLRLVQAAREADSANRAKTQFLSTMSHDIRTPMNAIIGLTTIAEKNSSDPEMVRENLRKISMAGNHLLTLINDILDISKVESGRLSLSPVTFSIVESAQNLVNLSQPMVREKNIDFNFRISRMVTEYLEADQLRLNQIFINILSNAIKYTEPGGTVSVDLLEEESSVPGSIRLTYRVADTGIGMSPEFMEKMYQPFSRQTDSRVNTVQGTGLGLAITKKMVDLMGGTIDCESESGKGTTFTVILDIPAATRQLDDMVLEPVSVLIVDDDEILLETARDTLQSIGADVDTAESGEEALGKIIRRHDAKDDYGVVIIDWKMPGMDGIETIKEIRDQLGYDIPILLISAYDWSDIEETAKAAGANGFVSKPLFRSTLYQKLSDVLGLKAKPVEPEEDNSELEGMRILIAEDNDVNWEIISMLLSMYGIETDRAVNGQVCVDMLKDADEDKYALVFMDIQMPVMNGLDATRAIRALEGSWAKDIPIIAMTADAFSENVTECLDAGMNGHIAKPVDIKLVIREIKKIKEGKINR